MSGSTPASISNAGEVMACRRLNQRRWRNFKANRRAYWSLWIFGFLFGLSLFAEFWPTTSRCWCSYRGELHTPIFTFYSETAFGGDFRTEAKYRDPEVQCLIVSGGVRTAWMIPRASWNGWRRARSRGAMPGWMIWPPIPYSATTRSTTSAARPLAARCRTLAGHRRHRARRAGAGDLRVPPVGVLRADRDAD
jgi:microcin C transport system permease protein